MLLYRRTLSLISFRSLQEKFSRQKKINRLVRFRVFYHHTNLIQGEFKLSVFFCSPLSRQKSALSQKRLLGSLFSPPICLSPYLEITWGKKNKYAPAKRGHEKRSDRDEGKYLLLGRDKTVGRESNVYVRAESSSPLPGHGEMPARRRYSFAGAAT